MKTTRSRGGAEGLRSGLFPRFGAIRSIAALMEQAADTDDAAAIEAPSETPGEPYFAAASVQPKTLP